MAAVPETIPSTLFLSTETSGPCGRGQTPKGQSRRKGLWGWGGMESCPSEDRLAQRKWVPEENTSETISGEIGSRMQHALVAQSRFWKGCEVIDLQRTESLPVSVQWAHFIRRRRRVALAERRKMSRLHGPLCCQPTRQAPGTSGLFRSCCDATDSVVDVPSRGPSLETGACY